MLATVASVAAQDSPTPELVGERYSPSPRVLAVSAKNYQGVVPKRGEEFFQPGEDARVVIFVSNVDLLPEEGANAFRVYVENAAGKVFRLQVESLEPVKPSPGVYALTVNLYDEIAFNGQPNAEGDFKIRLTWRGMTSSQLRVGLGSQQENFKDANLFVAPAKQKSEPPVTRKNARSGGFQQTQLGDAYGERQRFMQQAAFGANPAVDLRIRQIGIHRWIEEQFNKPQTYPYPNLPLVSTDASVGCPLVDTDPLDAVCRRDHYSQYRNQNWMFLEAMYGEDQLRRRVSWALHQIWVVSGVDTQQQRWEQEYIEVLDRHAFGNYRNLMSEMTLQPAMGNYLDMIRSTRTNPNENYPREILQLFSIGLVKLNQDGTPVDGDPNTPGVQVVDTYTQDDVNNFTKVFTGWNLCNQAPPTCPNAVTGAPNYVDPMRLNSANHDLTAKTLFTYTQANGQPAPFPTIAACANCTNDATRIPYAEQSLTRTLDNIFYHPNTAPFVSKLLIQHLVTSDPTPAYVGRVAAVFNNDGAGVRGDMKAVIRAILLDPEARGSYKTAPDYGKLRDPFHYAVGMMRHFDAKSADRTQNSDGYINPQTNAMGQNIWNPPTVFNYYPPDYIVPGTDLLGPEFGITNTGTAFARINFINTMVYGTIAANGANNTAPLGTSLSLAEAQAWAGQDTATANALIEGLNRKMMHGTMSQAMKDRIRTAVVAIPAANTLNRARQAVYLVATSSQYQVQK